VRPVVWSDAALDDYDKAIAYITERNPVAADRVADRIEETGEALGHMPTGRPGRVTGTYEKIVRGLPHIIAYAIRSLPQGGEAVVILRVIHGARNWPEEQWPE
jgi:toxin ParE1/3/4